MIRVFPDDKWTKGNPDFKHDYFPNDSPLEFTITSNKNKKSNFIIKLKTAHYVTDNVERDIFKYIEHPIQVKLRKKYSVRNVHFSYFV